MAENRSRLKTGKSPSRSATRSKLGSIKRATRGMRERKERESFAGMRAGPKTKVPSLSKRIAMYPSVYEGGGRSGMSTPYVRGRDHLRTTDMEGRKRSLAPLGPLAHRSRSVEARPKRVYKKPATTNGRSRLRR